MSAASSPVPLNSTAAPMPLFGWLALVGLTALALVLRLFHVEQWSWDAAEAATWTAITQPVAGDGGFVNSPAGRAPLVPMALRWLLDCGLLPSADEGWLRLPFVFVGTCTVPLLALSARFALGTFGAGTAALLLAIHPLHVQASQTAAAPVVAMAVVWLAAVACARSRAWLALALGAAAGGCASLGFAVLAGLWARVGGRLARLGPWVALPVCAVGGLHAYGTLGIGIVVAAALGVLVRAALPAAWLLAWAGLVLAAACGGGEPELALPLWVVFAAQGLGGLGRTLWTALRPLGLRSRLAAATPLAMVLGTLAIPTFLNATVHHGERAEWRRAAATVVRALGGRSRWIAAAGAGLEPLRCYLRPEHHRVPGSDPYPNRGLQPFVVERGDAALTELLARGRPGEQVLVLTTAEHAQLIADPAAAQRLAGAFVCAAALPGPRCDRDEGVLVFVARVGH